MAPLPSTSWSSFPCGMWPEPWNIMCSNRWAKPVWPGSSFAAPTWYQMLVETVETCGSRDRITCNPLGST